MQAIYLQEHAPMQTESGMTATELAAELGISVDGIRKRLKLAFPENGFSAVRTLSATEISVVRTAGRSGNPPEKAAPISANGRTNLIVTETEIPATDAERNTPTDERSAETEIPATETTTPVAGNFLRTNQFLLFAMVAGMVSQMVHTGGFFYNNSPITQEELKMALSVLFALGVDSTALILTIHRGGKKYLYTFAVIHFLMNVTFHTQVHSFSWEFKSAVGIFGYLLLSFVIAFSNFSYTELFSEKKI